MLAAIPSGKLHAFPLYDALTHDKVAANLNRNVPDELKELSAYVVFKYKPAKHEGAKRGKVPYYVRTMRPRSGTQGTTEDLAAMVPFEDALARYTSRDDV